MLMEHIPSYIVNRLCGSPEFIDIVATNLIFGLCCPHVLVESVAPNFIYGLSGSRVLVYVLPVKPVVVFVAHSIPFFTCQARIIFGSIKTITSQTVSAGSPSRPSICYVPSKNFNALCHQIVLAEYYRNKSNFFSEI